MVIVIIIWLILSILVANMGSLKQIGGAGAFFISLIFSPLIGLLFVIASSPLKNEKKNEPNKMVIKLTSEATKKFNKKEYNSAIEILLKALSFGPKVAQTHFNLSTLYSLTGNKEKAFIHLSRAVEYGYGNFNKIATTKDLNWLRQQPEYKIFMDSGYKLKSNENLSKDYIIELNELSILKEKGILTEEEFEIKKRKILDL